MESLSALQTLPSLALFCPHSADDRYTLPQSCSDVNYLAQQGDVMAWVPVIVSGTHRLASCQSLAISAWGCCQTDFIVDTSGSPALLRSMTTNLWHPSRSGRSSDLKATFRDVISATCSLALQEVFSPEVRKYLERLSSLEPVQKGVAQALGKKATVLQPRQTGHAAPKVPIEGRSASTGTCVTCKPTLDDNTPVGGTAFTPDVQD